MSIPDLIKTLEEVGRLFRYVPVSRKKLRRRLYLSATAMSQLHDAKSALNVLKLRGFVEASMSRWVLGEHIYVDDDGNPGFLKRLKRPPPEVWEIRVTEPDIQVRLFGRFAEPDTLVLGCFRTRNLLGKKGSRAWKDAMEETVQIWVSLFPNLAPFSCGEIHDYVTENCDDFALE